eukprot:TRINITY_DN3116_c0_g1_i1.p1 TRINITY_DN3116_c0_g1~~TRINITY_DN3116_c0_g1_i1.p1  ORF type:complete len:379 (+),score=42.32 TRINITY_DN3116_c0_g1_i1:81-1217(+)
MASSLGPDPPCVAAASPCNLVRQEKLSTPQKRRRRLQRAAVRCAIVSSGNLCNEVPFLRESCGTCRSLSCEDLQSFPPVSDQISFLLGQLFELVPLLRAMVGVAPSACHAARSNDVSWNVDAAEFRPDTRQCGDAALSAACDASVPRDNVEERDCLQGVWESLPFLIESDVLPLRVVSKHHRFLVGNGRLFCSKACNPFLEDACLLHVAFPEDRCLSMDNVVDVLEHFGEVSPVDWTNTPRGDQLITLRFANASDAVRASEAGIASIANDAGESINIRVFLGCEEAHVETDEGQLTSNCTVLVQYMNKGNASLSPDDLLPVFERFGSVELLDGEYLPNGRIVVKFGYTCSEHAAAACQAGITTINNARGKHVNVDISQ